MNKPMLRSLGLLCCAALVCITTPVMAANWYVDNSVVSSGAGTSWAAAWKDFNNIVWASVAAGDTIYISGGSTSQTYNASLLTVGKSGGVGNPITITNGVDAGHNGQVIIDGTTTSTSGGAGIVDNGGFTNFVIQNLTVQNSFEKCIGIHGISSGSIVVQGMTVHTGDGVQKLVATNAATSSGAVLHFASGSIPNFATYASQNVGVEDRTTPSAIPVIAGNNWITASTSTSLTMNTNIAGGGVLNGDTIAIGVQNARAFDIRSNTGGTITIQNNTVDTPALSPAQTDTLYSTGNTNATITVQQNSFTIPNQDGAWHSDTFQSVNDNNITFRQNFLSHPNGGFNNHGVVIDSIVNGGTLYFYDNIILMQGGANAESSFFRENLSGTTGIIKIWNNTIYGQWDGVTFTGTTPAGDEFKNNIIYLASGGAGTAAPYQLSSGNITSSIIDYNTVFTTAGHGIANVSGVGNGRTWAQWQTAGYDAHGVNADPLLVTVPPAVAANVKLQSGSPARDAGVTVATVAVDYDGIARPQGSAYDIGAYEYVGSFPPWLLLRSQ